MLHFKLCFHNYCISVPANPFAFWHLRKSAVIDALSWSVLIWNFSYLVLDCMTKYLLKNFRENSNTFAWECPHLYQKSACKTLDSRFSEDFCGENLTRKVTRGFVASHWRVESHIVMSVISMSSISIGSNPRTNTLPNQAKKDRFESVLEYQLNISFLVFSLVRSNVFTTYCTPVNQCSARRNLHWLRSRLF